MTIREAFENHGYWMVAANPSQREAIRAWWLANFPDDRYYSVRANQPYVAFLPHSWQLLDGHEYFPEDPSHLLVPSIQRLRDGVEALAARRIVLPLQGNHAINNRRASFFRVAGGAYMGNLGFLTKQDFQDLADFITADTDPVI